jgi:hypothetical protein
LPQSGWSHWTQVVVAIVRGVCGAGVCKRTTRQPEFFWGGRGVVRGKTAKKKQRSCLTLSLSAPPPLFFSVGTVCPGTPARHEGRRGYV